MYVYKYIKGIKERVYGGSVVVAQLAEWSLPILEVGSSNPVIGIVL